MENYQKVEQLVSKAGCSYEEAKTALEANGWDMIDAIVSLEREGKVKAEEPGMAVQYAEESVEVSRMCRQMRSKANSTARSHAAAMVTRAVPEKKGLQSASTDS